MSSLLNAEQSMLRDAAATFVAQRSPVAAQRRLRDAARAHSKADRDGSAGLLQFDMTLWAEMAAMGWAAAPFDEADGGLGAGWKSIGAIAEQLGRHLCATPLVSCIALGASLLQQSSNASLRAVWLPRLLDGSARVAVAVDEAPYHAPEHIECTATEGAAGWYLNGIKTSVLDAVGAEAFIVAARFAGTQALGLFWIEAQANGATLQATPRIDSRNAATLALRQVVVPANALLDQGEAAQQSLATALDRARICFAAETLGLLKATFEMTVSYLKERVQFDVPIGSFQALQHRAARLHVGLELLQSCVAAALAALDAQSPDVAQLASLAKARAAELGEQLCNEALQMHGGIGVTDEFNLGLFFKRARVLAHSLGDAAFHRSRYASLRGF